MGVSTVTAVRILDGQLKGGYGEENILAWEKFPHVALSKTYNTNQQVPDSAGTATAFMTGVKTKAGFINVREEAIRGDCASSIGNHLTSALERAEDMGLSTGVVTTARLTHATPATTYAHTPERDWEADSNLPEDALKRGCRDIARQLIEFSHGDGLEVALGGGRRNFFPENTPDPEGDGKTGLRKDGRDLTREWLHKYGNAAYVWNEQQFKNIDVRKTDHLLGLFEHGHMEFDSDRLTDVAGEPALADMTETAIRILQKNKNGYFLMVEAGRIDHGHHKGIAYKALHDGIALNKAVEKAVSMTDISDTLIIVTADHSHTFVIAGYPTRGNPILGKVITNDAFGNPNHTPFLAPDGKPMTTLGYYVTPGANHDGERQDITTVDTEHKDYVQQAAIPAKSGHHGGEDVAIYAQGPHAESIHGVMEQNKIYDVIKKALKFK